MVLLKMAELPVLKARFRGVLAEWIQSARADTEGARYAAWVSVWGRWVVWGAAMAGAAYRPEWKRRHVPSLCFSSCGSGRL